eukprot:jgi/Bigna1/66482/fgenesh1_pg.1_\
MSLFEAGLPERRGLHARTRKCFIRVWGRSTLGPKLHPSSPMTADSSLCTFNSLVFGVYFVGAHEPAAFGWEAYNVLNSIGIAILLTLFLFLTYLVSNAAYSTANLTAKKPKFSSGIITCGVVVVLLTMLTSMIGTLVADDFRFNAAKHLAISVTIWVAGIFYLYSLWRLRSFLIETTKNSTGMSKASTIRSTTTRYEEKNTISQNLMRLPENRREGASEMSELSPKRVSHFGVSQQVHKPASVQREENSKTMGGRLEVSVSMSASMTGPSRSAASKSAKSHQSPRSSGANLLRRRKQKAVAAAKTIRKLNWLILSTLLLVPVIGVSFIYYFFVQATIDISYSEDWRIESENYKDDVDFGMWLSIVGNMYFMYYSSPRSS